MRHTFLLSKYHWPGELVRKGAPFTTISELCIIRWFVVVAVLAVVVCVCFNSGLSLLLSTLTNYLWHSIFQILAVQKYKSWEIISWLEMARPTSSLSKIILRETFCTNNQRWAAYTLTRVYFTATVFHIRAYKGKCFFYFSRFNPGICLVKFISTAPHMCTHICTPL